MSRPKDADSRRLTEEIERELAFHLEMRTRANLARGMSARAARKDAERRLGDLGEIKSAGLSIFAGKPPRRGPRFSPAALLEDLRMAARRLRQEPLVTILLVGLIGAGIAANAAIFGVVNAVLLQPLDFPRPERMVRLYSWQIEDQDDAGVSPPDLADWATSDTMAYAALFNTVDMRVTGADEPRTLEGGTATAAFFDVLGVEPVEGRRFNAADIAGDERVVVLTERGRQALLGAQSDVLGATVRLDGEPWTVIGVIPQPGYPFNTELFWIPWAYDYDAPEHRGFRVFNAIGRLADGVTLERAREDLEQIGARLVEAYPDSNEGWSVQVLPLHESMLGHDRKGVFLLLGAVTLLLLITCANVAGLMLARAARMRREIAVRGALGADRWRLLGHLAADSALLALGGGLVALPLATWGIALIKLISPPDTPRLEQAGIDGTVALYAFVLTAVVLVATGLTSAWGASRADLMRPLRAAATSHTGADRGLWRKTLVAVEAGLAVILVIGAGLLARSFLELGNVDLGYRPDNVLAVRLELFAEDYPDDPRRIELFRAALAGSRRIAGIEAATLAASIPQGPGFSLRGLRGVGSDPDQELMAEYQRVSRGYFDTLAIPLLRGRDFSADEDTAKREMIVSESFARTVWPADEQLGLGQPVVIGPDEWHVVGVAADLRYGIKRPPRPTMYVHYTHEPGRALYALLRTAEDPTAALPAFRAMLWSLDPEMPIEWAMPIEQRIAGALAGDVFRLRLVGAFTLVAVALACLGIYGLMAYTVAQRTREIGVRMALGATRSVIVGKMLAEGARVIAAGVLVGVLASAALSRFVASFLYEVTAYDPLAFTLFPLAVAIAGLAACILPARRAAATDPVVAMRAE